MTRKREREGGREKAGGEDGEDRERERERENMQESTNLHWCLPLSSAFVLGAPASGIAPLTFRAGLPFSVNPFWKCHHRHTQRCALLIS
jgi:hypothetical protein